MESASKGEEEKRQDKKSRCQTGVNCKVSLLQFFLMMICDMNFFVRRGLKTPKIEKRNMVLISAFSTQIFRTVFESQSLITLNQRVKNNGPFTEVHWHSLKNKFV